MELELDGFAAHAAPLPGAARGRAGVTGDAPSAGGGLQVAGDVQEEACAGGDERVWGEEAAGEERRGGRGPAADF